jgi:enoyl-CoA hydratase/carnithine racemase
MLLDVHDFRDPRPTVTVELDRGIATVTIDRPPANALDDRTLDLLRQTLGELGGRQPRGVLLTGAGDRFFSAGGDVKELEDGLDHRRGTGRVDRFNAVLGALAEFEAPVAVAANGTAVGGGTELLLAADRAFGVRGARYGLPEINHGLLPSAASVARAVERLGFLPARRMLLSGDLFDADEALALGIVEQLADTAGEARAAARGWLEQMAAKPIVLVSALKRALHEAPGLDHDGHAALTRAQFTAYFEDPEASEARQAVVRRWSSARR